MNIALSQAEQAIAAAKQKAQDIDVPMTIAVVDTGGNLVALSRMDNALLASLDIAVGKAYTAIAMKMSTGDLTELVQPGQILYHLEIANQPRTLVTFAGGLPVHSDGSVIGGIGVSGGAPHQDQEVASAAQAVLQNG